jgi:DNA-binding IscR family transcriptional regulator
VEDKKEELFHFHENPNPDCPVGANIHAVMDGRLRKFKRNLQKDLDDVTLQDLVKDLRKELKKRPEALVYFHACGNRGDK